MMMVFQSRLPRHTRRQAGPSSQQTSEQWAQWRALGLAPAYLSSSTSFSSAWQDASAASSPALAARSSSSSDAWSCVFTGASLAYSHPSD